MAKYLDKVQNLMSAMEKNGFETFDGDRKEACDTVESAIMSFPEYTKPKNSSRQSHSWTPNAVTFITLLSAT